MFQQYLIALLTMNNLQFSYTHLHHLQYYYFFIESFNTNILILLT